MDRAYAEHLAEKLFERIEEERRLGEPSRTFATKVINSMADRFEMCFNRGRIEESEAR